MDEMVSGKSDIVDSIQTTSVMRALWDSKGIADCI
jgi:hypothetical protein